ncbi:MAG: YeeE/YedE family protein [Hyphomicrobiales bacterium]|nr:YeeE/YedE family protein [Hyphomicrobiales bacterium]
MEDLSINTVVALYGFGLGLVFGAIVLATNFCTMGSISDILTFGDHRRFRAWLLAAATALIGAQVMHRFGVIDLGASIYPIPRFNYVGNIVGGLMFGFGMVFAGGCASRNLARVGAGDLRSLFVLLFIGIFGYMTLRGLIALGRVEIEEKVVVDLAASGIDDQTIGGLLAGLGPDAALLNTVAAIVVAAAILVYCFGNAAFRGSPKNIIAGLGIGLCVVAGWWITGVVGADEFDPTPLASLTFVAPTGNSIIYLMTFSGATIDFGIATVGGTILGAFIAALATRRFNLTSFADVGDTLRNMFGGAFMGVGGVVALGCTVGQAITGVSTLAVGSFLAFAAIVLGAVIGLKTMERMLG